MKKVICITVAVALLAAFVAGCAPAAQTADLSGIQEQLDQISGELSSLRTDVEALQGSGTTGQKPTEGASDRKDAAPAPEAAVDTTTGAQPSAAAQASSGDYGVAELTGKVNEMVSKMGAATAQTMLDVKAEAKALENEIDAQENAAEHDYRQGILSRTDFNAIDSELEHLEDQLDHAEDEMEYRLGYDD